jgi:hypothetical protein
MSDVFLHSGVNLNPRALSNSNSSIRASTSKQLVIRYLLLYIKLVIYSNTSKTLEN